MEKNFKLHRPVVVSQWSAENETENWQKMQRSKVFRDADGYAWHLSEQLSEKPRGGSTSKLDWSLDIRFIHRGDRHSLVQGKTFSESEDARLLEFFGVEIFEFHFIPETIIARSENILANRLDAYLEDFSSEFASFSFQAKRRELLGQWVDRSCQFSKKQKNILTISGRNFR